MAQNCINSEIIKADKSHQQKNIKLTVMCIIYKQNGEFLVMNRSKKDWPGLTFPGGHVEDNELIIDAVKREMKEETGFDIDSIEPKGYIEWNDFGDDKRHLAMLFKSTSFTGDLKPSNEGEIFFISEDQINDFDLSNDFMKIYRLIK